MRIFEPVTVTVLLGVGSLAASSFLFVKVLVGQISPSEIVAGRVFFGSIALFGVIAVQKTPLNLTPGLIGRVAVFAALETVVPFTLIASAERELDSGLAAVLISSMPLFTLLFATLLPTDERLTPAGVAGLGLGFLGIVVLSGIGADAVVGGNALSRLAVLGAAASYAAAGVYARLLLQAESALGVSALQLACATLLALPLAFVTSGTPTYDLDVGGWAALLTLGIAGSGVMLLGFLWLVGKTGSIGASMVTYVVPFVGVLLGWAVLGESISERTVLGLALVLSGVAATMSGGTQPASTRMAT